MILDLEFMYYYGYYWMIVGIILLVWYCYIYFMFDGGWGIEGGGEKIEFIIFNF